MLTPRWPGTYPTKSGKRFHCLTTLHAKLFALLLFPLGLSDGLLSPGLRESLNSRVASRSGSLQIMQIIPKLSVFFEGLFCICCALSLSSFAEKA